MTKNPTVSDYKKIFIYHPEIQNRLISRESERVEFKESFNWGSKDLYARSMAAFANKKGGCIVFGVKSKPHDLVGLRSNNFEEKDEATIAEYMNSVLAPEVRFGKIVLVENGLRIGILYVEEAKAKPIVCIKNDGEGLKEAGIYYRYNAITQKIKYPELMTLIDEVRGKVRQEWMDFVQKISKADPSATALLDTAKGTIDTKGTNLLIDEKLLPKLKFIQEGKFSDKGQPTLKLIGDVKPVSFVVSDKKSGRSLGVRVTDNPNAPEVRLTEDSFESMLGYDEVAIRSRQRYSNFKQAKKFHDLIHKYKQDSRLSRSRLANPKKPGGQKAYFYYPLIFDDLDRYFTLRPEFQKDISK